MATTIKFSMVKEKMDALKAQGLDEATIALVMAGMGIQVVKSDKDIEREAIQSLSSETILEMMKWFSKVPYKTKWSYTQGMYRRHWSKAPKAKEIVTRNNGEKIEITLPPVYTPTDAELAKSWECMKVSKDKDLAIELYKDYAKDNAFALKGDERYSNSVALPNTRGGQVD